MARKRRTRKRRRRRRRRGGAEWGTGKEAYMSPAQTKASQDRFKKARALFSGKSTASPKNLYPTGSYLNRKSPTSVTKATVGPSALRMGIGSKAADASAKRFAELRAKFQKSKTRKRPKSARKLGGRRRRRKTRRRRRRRKSRRRRRRKSRRRRRRTRRRRRR